MRYLRIILSCMALATLCSAATMPPVAYVYVSTTKGIYLYDAASTGKLTLVGGPYAVKGLPIGSNGHYFFSVGTDYIRSYALAANGAIKHQVSQINTQLYSGAECGTTAGGTLDHTGQFLYVQLGGAIIDGGGICDAYQTFKVSATGLLTFTGSTGFDNQGRFTAPGTPLAVTGNELFAYNQTGVGQSCQQQVDAFSRESSGAVNSITFTEVDPPPLSGPIYFIPNGPIATDPTNHFAVAVIPQEPGPCGNTYPAQLASYSVDSQGNIATTNIGDLSGTNMPTPNVNPGVLNMSPSGTLLAVGGDTGNQGTYQQAYATPGLQVYRFNGANLITPYSAVLTTDPIDEIRWDKANHLYALSSQTWKLHIFTVTTTSISPGGLTYSIPNANGLFVVPK